VSDVKGQPGSRAARGARTRARIVQAAYELFCEAGYRSTTMEAIAERTGVAVQTVYFNFRTKDLLLQAVHAWTVLGDNPMPPPLQPWHREAMEANDGPTAVRRLSTGLATLNARVAPLLPVFYAVASDPAGEIWRRSEDLRRSDMTLLLDALTQKTRLRRGLPRRRAADLLHVILGPECYRAFVIDLGWTSKEWAAWASTTLTQDLWRADQ